MTGPVAIKLFDFRERRPTIEGLRAPIHEAANGGQGLLLHVAIKGIPAPGCFKRSKAWGKLYDQDVKRLVQTAAGLGVKRIVVHHNGTPKQHVDLCGGPLLKALRDIEATPLLAMRG